METKIEIQLDRNALTPILSQVANIIGRSDKEIMQHIHCSVKDGNSISFTAVNESMQMVATMALSNPTTDCAFTLPAKRFLDMARMGQNDEIKLVVDGNTVKVRCGRNNSTLASLDEKIYPVLPFEESETKMVLSAQLLLDAIQSTDFSMAKNDARYFLNGVKMEFNNEEKSLKTIATDGHRLAYRSIKVEKEFESLGIILPSTAISKLKSLLKAEKGDVELTIGRGGNNIHFKFTDYSLYSKLVDGRFPDYRRVIPRVTNMEFLVDREEFKNMLQRIKVFSAQEFAAASFIFNGNELTVKSVNRQSADSSEETMAVELKTEDSNGSIEIGLNLSYVLDIATHLTSDKLLFKVMDQSSPVMMIPEVQEESEDTKYIVMPMRI